MIPHLRITMLLASGAFFLCSLTLSGDGSTDRPMPANPIELGEALFHDVILSGDRTVSCASCHKPEFAFADNASLSEGVGGQLTKRNTPTAMYLNYRKFFFWDGRAGSLEEQALIPIASPEEMDLAIPEAVSRLKENPFFARAFEHVYQTEPSSTTLAHALASFQKNLTTYTAPYDRYMEGDYKAMSKSALRGMELFLYDAGCVFCHKEPHFGNNDFFNIGLYNGADKTDVGRFKVTGDSLDLGSFETPTLRNIAVTAPYMHDGSMATLMEVLEYYNDPDAMVSNSLNRHENMIKLNLDKKQLKDLEAFLLTLTDERYE
ncbi:cytochrome-c peroxidase [Roseivirga sp. BDSF3-8]|uniref:cytochrome-c peroxidase n=1 Tax=Roseivirga sp. BDSF3-8 TaxID=3241598 RepID=UPI003531CED1